MAATFDLDNVAPTTPALIRQGDTVCSLFEDFSGTVDKRERNGNMVLLTLTTGEAKLFEADAEFVETVEW